MSGRYAILAYFLTVALMMVGGMVSVSNALAGDNRKAERFWREHAVAKKALLSAWTTDAGMDMYARAAFSIGKYETFLLASDYARPDDSRLVGKLGKNMHSRYDYPAFASRVFRYELKHLTGLGLHPMNLFRGKSFPVGKRKD